MGNGASEEAPSISPQLCLGDSPKKIEMMACNDNSVMILTPTKNVEVRNFDGTSIIKPLNLQPTCCCATRSGGWVIGFNSGHLSEFDNSFQLLVSYRTPGNFRAHEGSVLLVLENEDLTNEGFYHLASIGSDNSLNFWSKTGNHLYKFKFEPNFTSLCLTSCIAYLADDHQHIHSVNAEKFNSYTVNLPCNAKSIGSLGERDLILAILENGTVSIISPNQVIIKFQFLNNPNPSRILPLVVESQTGLITYVVLDQNKKLTLRALEKVTAELGEVNPMYAVSRNNIVTIKSNNIVVYSLSELETASMMVLPDMELPRKQISKYLSQK